MLNFVIGLVSWTGEYKDFGLNLRTAAFFLTVILTFWVQLPAVLGQVREVRNAKSAENVKGVDTRMMMAILTFFTVFFLYGMFTGSVGVMCNAIVLGPPYLLVVWRLWKLRGLGLQELATLAACCLVVALMIVLPYKQYIYMASSIPTGIALLGQISQLKEKGTSEGLSADFPKKFALVSALWTVYGMLSKDAFVAISAAVFGLLYWRIYRLTIYYRPALA